MMHTTVGGDTVPARKVQRAEAVGAQDGRELGVFTPGERLFLQVCE